METFLNYVVPEVRMECLYNLCCAGTGRVLTACEAHCNARGVPLEVLRLNEPPAWRVCGKTKLYPAQLLLDLH